METGVGRVLIGDKVLKNYVYSVTLGMNVTNQSDDAKVLILRLSVPH